MCTNEGAQQGEGELPFGEQLMAAYKKVGPMERIVLLGLWGQNHSRVRLTYKRTGAKKNSLAKLCVMITGQPRPQPGIRLQTLFVLRGLEPG